MRMRNKPGDSDGFTLVEMLVVVALLGALMLVLTEFFLGSNRVYQTQSAELGVNMSARTALDDIDIYVRQATQVVSSFGSYATGPSQLILQVQSVNSSGQLVPGEYDHVVFHLNGQTLYRDITPSSASAREAGSKAIGTDIQSLNFTYDNASLPQVSAVTTDLTVSKNMGRDTQRIVISSKARIRN